MVRIREILMNVWSFLREACGENDYARYRAHALARGVEPEPQETFYLNKLHRKYSTPSRCC
jgi:hypothetical protein